MSYTITVPAVGEFGEESFTVETSRKPEALREVISSLYPDGPKATWAYLRKHAVCVKHVAPKKSEWRTCDLCPEAENQILRSELYEHVRGFHGIPEEVKE